MHLLAHVGFYDTYGYYVRGFYRLLRHHVSWAPVEPLSPPSLPLPTVFESTALSGSEDLEWLFGPKGDDKIDTAMSSVHGLDHELSSVPMGPNHGSTNVVQTPAPDPVLSTANPNRLMESANSKSSSSSDSSTLSSSISNSEDFE